MTVFCCEERQYKMEYRQMDTESALTVYSVWLHVVGRNQWVFSHNKRENMVHLLQTHNPTFVASRQC